MTERRPLVRKNGRTVELPDGDSILASPFVYSKILKTNQTAWSVTTTTQDLFTDTPNGVVLPAGDFIFDYVSHIETPNKTGTNTAILTFSGASVVGGYARLYGGSTIGGGTSGADETRVLSYLDARIFAPSGASSREFCIGFGSILLTSTGAKLIPQITWSSANFGSDAVLRAGSQFRIMPVGASGAVGPWS